MAAYGSKRTPANEPLSWPASPTVSEMPQTRHEPRRRGRKRDVDDQRKAQ